LCQRLVDGALGARAARNRAAAWSRSPAHGTIPGTRRPGLAAAPSPAPRSRSWSWWRLRSWWRPAAGLRARLAGWRVGSGSAGAGGGSGRCGRCGRRGDLGPRGSRRRAGRAAALRGSVGGGSVGGGSVGGGSVRAPGFGAQSRRAARSRSWSRLRRSSGRRRRRARFLGGICRERERTAGQLFVRLPGGYGRPGSSAPAPRARAGRAAAALAGANDERVRSLGAFASFPATKLRSKQTWPASCFSCPSVVAAQERAAPAKVRRS